MFKHYFNTIKNKLFNSINSPTEPPLVSKINSNVNQINIQIENVDKNDLKNETKDDTENRNQLMSTIVTTLIEGTKIIMATLLSIFVPQYCSDTGTTCTFSQNFKDLSSFNEFVIFINFLTLALFIKLILVQNKREAYLISHLDESKDYPANSLEDNIKSYPRILSRIKIHNHKLKKYTNVVIILFCFNVLFSSILIFHFFYDGFRSISTLLSNVLLVSSKLYNLHKVSKECNGFKQQAMSSIHQTTISYNIPDKKYDTYNLFHIKTKMNSLNNKNNPIFNRFLNKNKHHLIKKYKSTAEKINNV